MTDDWLSALEAFADLYEEQQEEDKPTDDEELDTRELTSEEDLDD